MVNTIVPAPNHSSHVAQRPIDNQPLVIVNTVVLSEALESRRSEVGAKRQPAPQRNRGCLLPLRASALLFRQAGLRDLFEHLAGYLVVTVIDGQISE